MTAARHERIGTVDFARGVALLGMVIFHAAWDLHALGLSELDPGGSTGWRMFGHAVAGSFLFLSGFGLVLADRAGADTRAAIRRIGLIFAAAMAVSLATWLAAPGQLIVFGILHCIAVSNLLALGLLRASPRLVLILAGLAFVLPLAAPRALPDELWWLGLSPTIPDTLDYRPLLPWFGVVLLGVGFGRSGGLLAVRRLPDPQGRPATFLRAAGRHSLAVYLLHQPLILAVLSVAAGSTVHFAPVPDEGSPFMARCLPACEDKGVDHARCDTMCLCAYDRMSMFGGSDRPSGDTLAAAAAACAIVRP